MQPAVSELRPVVGAPARLFERAIAMLNWVGSIWVVLLMLLITADVVGRAAFNAPLAGVPEIVKVSIVGLVWCQMAHTLKIGAHLRSTILLDRMPAGIRTAIELASYLLGMVTFALIVYSGWDNTVEAWRIGEFEGEEPVRVPTYPIRTLVLLGSAVTAIQFAVMAAGVLRRFRPTRDATES
jgi:TRAP-type mannitol/chloroaromatic compound transport system permease small subunit